MPLKKTLLLLLCIASTKCYCQAYTINKHFSTDDGLLTNSIGRIEKDNNGFYWFQSQEGLVRFDGKKLSIFKGSDIPYSHLDSGIKNCQLFFFSTQYGEIIFLNSQSKLSKISNTRNIHIGQFYRKKILLNSSEESIKLKNTKANYEYIIKLFNSSDHLYEVIDEHSSYIIGARGDLIYLEDGLIKNKCKKPNDLYTHFVVNDYLVLVNLKTFTYYIFKKGEEVFNIKLSDVNIFNRQQSISVEQCFENKSLLQIGNTIYTAALTNNQIDFSPFFQLPSNISQSDFFYDNINNKLLIYSPNSGVYIFNITKFNTYNTNNTTLSKIIYSQAVSNRGIITNQDIYKNIIEKEYAKWSWLYTGPICVINNKQILTTTHKSLIITDTEFKNIKTLKHENLNLGSNSVSSIIKTDSVVYISGNTLLKYHIKNQTLTSILSEGITGKGKVDYIEKSPNANCIYVCADGILREVNTNSKQSTVIAKGFTSEVRHIYYDSSTNVIFVSTRDEGCYCVMPNGKIIKLPSGINQSFKTCHYVLQDKQGDYWLPTNNGLYCLLKKDLLTYIKKQVTNVIYKFWGKNDGIINEEFNGGFTGSGILIGDSISLSSMEGRVVFNPNIKYDVQKETGRLIIDAIEVNDSSIGTASTLIELEPNFKQLTVKVAYPFINNSKGVIEYRLLGTNDTTWHAVNENGVLDITNLQAGKYTLSIKVGSQPVNLKVMAIKVRPYWYNTLWMYGLYTLAVGILLYLLFSWRLLKLKNKQLAQLEQTKSRLFTTIAHDLRSPINNFTTLSDTMQFLIAEKDFDTIAAIGADMDKKSKNLTLLLSNILEWSLDEQGIKANTKNTINLQLLLTSIMPLYTDIAANKQVTINNQVAQQLIFTTNEQALSTILRNLVDNAIKNAVNNSVFNIYAQQNDSCIYLQVSNTAIPTAIPKLKVIQTLLLQGKTIAPLADGAGLGLALVHNNVVKLGGSIKIVINKQTVTFYVELPVMA